MVAIKVQGVTRTVGFLELKKVEDVLSHEVEGKKRTGTGVNYPINSARTARRAR
jgi:hypothetical protein